MHQKTKIYLNLLKMSQEKSNKWTKMSLQGQENKEQNGRLQPSYIIYYIKCKWTVVKKS